MGFLSRSESALVNMRGRLAAAAAATISRGRRLLSGFSGMMVAAATIISGLLAVANYLGWTIPSGLDTGGFVSTVIRADPIHIGNAPNWIDGEGYPFLGPNPKFSFDCPDVDPNQIAVLTFEVFDVKATRHMALNGVLLSDKPEVLNVEKGTWDTIAVIIDPPILKSADNQLHVVALDSDGQTTGDPDDFLIRGITVLYKPRESA
jgi:hypothetical protein